MVQRCCSDPVPFASLEGVEQSDIGPRALSDCKQGGSDDSVTLGRVDGSGKHGGTEEEANVTGGSEEDKEEGVKRGKWSGFSRHERRTRGWRLKKIKKRAGDDVLGAIYRLRDWDIKRSTKYN